MIYVRLSGHFTRNGMRNVRVSFVPDADVTCDPPYEAGQQDSRWCSGETAWPPVTNRKRWECRLGLPLRPMTIEKDHTHALEV